jgi:hypothetical protein
MIPQPLSFPSSDYIGDLHLIHPFYSMPSRVHQTTAQKRSHSNAQIEDTSVKKSRRITRATRANDKLRSPPYTPPLSESDPPLATPSAGYQDKTVPMIASYDSNCETPSTPQSFPTRTNSSSATISSSPPVSLSKFAWAPQSTVKIKRPGFRVHTSAQPGASTGSKWAVVLGQVSKMYTYTRIPKNQVRLLLIKPGAFDEQINASLLVVNDDHLGSEEYSYAALSYNWGNSGYDNTIVIQDDPSSRPVKSMGKVVDALRAAAQDKMLKVKPNLYDALKHLRRDNDVLALWVDALCIDQFDKDEKEE